MQLIIKEGKKTNLITGEKISDTKYGLHVVAEAAGVVWDTVEASYPTSSQEVYTYKANGVVVRTVTVTYTNSLKEVLLSIVRS